MKKKFMFREVTANNITHYFINNSEVDFNTYQTLSSDDSLDYEREESVAPEKLFPLDAYEESLINLIDSIRTLDDKAAIELLKQNLSRVAAINYIKGSKDTLSEYRRDIADDICGMEDELDYLLDDVDYYDEGESE